MTKKDNYISTKRIVQSYYEGRFKLHKNTKSIYFDDNTFDIAKFRQEVYGKHGELLTDDQFIYELVYLEAEKQPFSPIEDYLTDVSDSYAEVDYKQALRDLAEKGLHIDPDSIEAKYIAKTLVAAVARVFEPGVKFDQALVLYGEQGFYKTSFFEVLAGDHNFTSIHLNNFDKDERMICQSKWIIELGEVEQSIKRAHMGKLKQFLSQREDTFRMPYARNTVTIPRSFILVGSTNKRDFLIDETGNRRFWIIDLKEKIDIEWVKNNRDLIWAAAVAAYLDQYPIYLNSTEQQISNATNKQYEKEDIWTPVIVQWLENRKEPFILAEIVQDALGKDVKSMNWLDQHRVKQILKQLGLEEPKKTTRYNGKAGRYWQPKQAEMLQLAA